MYTLYIRSHFDAAHFLEGYDGECAKLHGHRWVVEVAYKFEDTDLGNNVSGIDKKPVEGMLIDFGVLKSSLKSLLPDHQCLNHIFQFNPTAENLAKWLSDKIKMPHERVTVWETPECSVAYIPDPEQFTPEGREEVDLDAFRK